MEEITGSKNKLVLANGEAVEENNDTLTEKITEKWIAYSTNIGTRKYQQDSARIPDGNLLLQRKNICVLSDGMGGMASGEKASLLCVNTLFEDFYNEKPTENFPEFFRREIKKADTLVAAFTDDDGNSVESGATLASVIIDGNNLYWASVGDSRIYIIRGEEIVQVNEDHNYYYILSQQIKNGEITPEEADSDPTKEALISYIGIGGVELADINEVPFKLEENDIIMICSDGLYRTLNEDAIKMILDEYISNIPLAANMLTTSAYDNRIGGQDNTTVIIVKYNNH